MTADTVERVKIMIANEMEKREAVEKSRSDIRALFETLPDNENIVLKAKAAGRVVLLIKRADGKVELIDTALWPSQNIPVLTFQKDIEDITKHLGENIIGINEFLNQGSGVLSLSLHWPAFGSMENFTKLLQD